MVKVKYPELYEDGLKFGVDYDVGFDGCTEIDGIMVPRSVLIPLTPERADFYRKHLPAQMF